MKRITTTDFRDYRRDRFIDAQTAPAAWVRCGSVVASVHSGDRGGVIG